MKTRSFFKLSFVAAASLIPLTSCDKKDPGSEKPVVALVMKSLANEFFKTMSEGAEAHQKEHSSDYELIVNGISNETDLTAQVNLVEQMVARGVDAIVIAPADSKALVPALKRAADAGIVIVNIDNKLDDAALADTKTTIPFVGPDNREGAKMVGDAVAKKLSEGDKVAIIEGVPTAFNSIQRREGFKDAMNEAGMEIIGVQSGQWEMEQGNRIAAALLSENPGLKAILAANDSMALGAVSAVKAAGLDGKVLVAGFDNISAIRPMIQDGSVLATADQHGDQLAVFGIETALDILKGNAKPEDKKTTVDLITK